MIYYFRYFVAHKAYFFIPAIILVCMACSKGQFEIVDSTTGSDANGSCPFYPNGTLFAFKDTRKNNSDSTTQPVVVFMTWLSFDPASPLRKQVGNELKDYKEWLNMRDSLAIVFNSMADYQSSIKFETSVNDLTRNRPASDTMRGWLHFGSLTECTSFGSSTPPKAAQRQNLTFSKVVNGADDEETIGGSLTIQFIKTPEDEDSAVSGLVKADFKAPFVDENVARENLRMLGLLATIERVIDGQTPPPE